MIMNPTAIKHVVVDGHSLTLESFVAIARYNATVELAPSALEAMKKSRALAEKIAADGTRQVRDVVELGITLDERVADGFYFGRSLKIVQHLMSHPELLDRPLKEAIDLDC